MIIDIKRSTKPVNYNKAIKFLEKRLIKVSLKKKNELIWILEHPSTFTAGRKYTKDEILDKKIKLIHTSRGGKITWHGPGQLIVYFVINLKKRNKDIRKFLNLIENTIIETLEKFDIKTFSDRKNIGIWVNNLNKVEKVAAIGIKVRKWIAYHGFSININNSLLNYKKIIPCGIKNKSITNLKLIKNQNYKNIKKEILKNFITNLNKKVS